MDKLIVWVLMLAIFIGWWANLADVIAAAIGKAPPATVLEIIGVALIPLGAVMGFL